MSDGVGWVRSMRWVRGMCRSKEEEDGYTNWNSGRKVSGRRDSYDGIDLGTGRRSAGCVGLAPSVTSVMMSTLMDPGARVKRVGGSPALLSHGSDVTAHALNRKEEDTGCRENERVNVKICNN